MRIGLHCSTSGVLVKAARRAVEAGANCFQIFSSSPRTWRAVMPPREQVEDLRWFRAEHDLAPLVIHDSYLINLAAPDEEVRAKSIKAMRGELERAIVIGAEFLVIHPGSARQDPVEAGMERIVDSLRQASRGLRAPSGFALLLENTAGAGATIGRTLEELCELGGRLEGVLPFPVGYCLDTCHLFVSGYDVSTAAGLEETVRQARDVLGLERVPVIHANDSRGAFGSRLDRHANIGEGRIGLAGFRRIVNHPELRSKAFVLETPVDHPGDDQRNVEQLKKLCRKSRTATKKSS